jgi:hypothetical protein
MSTDLEIIEGVIDHDYDDLDIYNLKKSDALMMACQVFERKSRAAAFLHQETPSELIGVSVSFRELLFDFQDGLAMLIRWILERCKESSPRPSKARLLMAVEEAFNKAVEHARVEALFKPLRQGLFKVEEVDTTEGSECIRFKYATDEIARYEAMNEQILQEQSNTTIMKMHNLAPFAFASATNYTILEMKRSASRRMDIDFALPDEFRIGPYTVAQIKRIWAFVVTKALIENTDNQRRELPTLMRLHLERIEFPGTPIDLVKQFLDDLTFTGTKFNVAGKPIFTSFQTEPLLDINHGIKTISPRFILQYQPARNILSTLNRIYGDGASVDSDQKELTFIQELDEITSRYGNLITTCDVPINKTDVDYAVYDKSNHVLMVSELKWFNEPVTSVEIKNKDAELYKALTKQLPKYAEFITKDPSAFMSKAFHNAYPVEHIVPFVMTRGSIGSGRVQIPDYKVINIRMYRRALEDTSGNLREAIDRLATEEYYPKLGEHFSYVTDQYRNVGNVKILFEGHSILKEYTLRTLDDEYVKLGGQRVSIHATASSVAIEVPSYQIDVAPRRPNRSERRKKH